MISGEEESKRVICIASEPWTKVCLVPSVVRLPSVAARSWVLGLPGIITFSIDTQSGYTNRCDDTAGFSCAIEVFSVEGSASANVITSGVAKDFSRSCGGPWASGVTFDVDTGVVEDTNSGAGELLWDWRPVCISIVSGEVCWNRKF